MGLLFLGLSLASCKKEQTFDDKLSGTWKSSKVTYDNKDQTSVTDYTLVLQPSKEFDFTKTALLGGSTIRTGIWETNEARQEIILRYDDSTESERYDISGLDAKFMIAETILDGKRLEIEFKK